MRAITSAFSGATDILRPFKNRRRHQEFRRAVKTELGELLSGLPDGWFRKFLNAYPRVWDAADTAFAQGANPTEGAARMAVFLLADLIKKNLPAERRAAVVAELQVWANEPDNRKRPAKVPTDPWLSTIIVLEGQSHLRVKAGQLTPLTKEWMMREVFCALAGRTQDVIALETSTNR